MSGNGLEKRAINLLDKSSIEKGDNKENQSSAKYWVFTQFNYKNTYEWYDPNIINSPKGKQPLKKPPENITIEEGIQRFAVNFCSYLIYGKENATEKLTEHLQGCFVLRERKTFNYIKTNTNNQIHLQKMDKCLLANIIYCKKEKDFWEHSDKKFNIPKPPNKKKFISHIDRCKDAVKKAKRGKLLEIDADLLISNLKNLQQIQYLHLNESVQLDLHLGSKFGNYFKNHFIWIKGKTGTLKSYNAHKIAECLYIYMVKYCKTHDLPEPNKEIWGIPYIKDLNKWYQNYKWEKVMLIEEVQPDFCKKNISRFKRWFDQYAYPAEFKGGDVGLIRPEFIIITSNYSMDECFIQDGIDIEKDYAPMKRRILEITVDKMSYIIWPNHRLLTIEYNSKNTIIEYENQFIENVLTIQGHKENNTFNNELITDPKTIEQKINEFNYVIDLKSNLLPSNKQIINNNTNLQTNSNNNTDIAILVPETQQQDNIYSTPKRKSIDHIVIPETPIKKIKGKEPSLERQNAFILSNSLESIINTEESITPPNTPTFETFESEIEETDENIENFNQLTNSQETTIPQTDGANDSFELLKNKEKPNTSFTDGNNNTWISLKQKNFIEKQINTCVKINKIIKILKQKNKYSNDLLKNKHYKTQIDLFLLKKQKIIKQFKLDKYNWIDDDQYIDPNECHYCNSKTLNCCTCLGYYFDTLPFDNFKHKKIFINTVLKKIENKELKTLDNIKTYVLVMSNKLQQLYNEYANVENIIYEMKKDTNNTFDKIYSLKNRLDLTLININDIIKKNNLQLYKKTLKTNKCFYCTNNIKNVCECKKNGST